ncbi:uncharacterized protein TOT_020000713 [Theileria orientalis strain Shintoku]|uniref:PX domain-containing protein n=1 Tax=Theileria orientalis strain Shintoku TaxID=869250 RepID=J4CD36_THEOR|nr:uncharacterized protein TOT_020000713 [Theileria orientalis strain Shintoku]BAM40457.1 uncharacterized protein TOT_020000713 [Theileria orientalis strain Shintoku]|eukprot:XP_009690758.1 uncharacterized protein TOT_020000713 [Theileria orientalis strain Shintoku]
MDLSDFSIKVKRGNSHRFQYEIDVVYKDRKWSRYRTFSEFEQLYEDLVNSDFCDVPILPDVNLAAGLAALEDLHNAENYLNSFLNELFSRADTRCSRHLLEFVDLIHYLEYVPDPPKAKLLSSSPAANLSVSDCLLLEDHNLIIVAYEEKTFICKVGKLWSFIEKDILGLLRIFKYGMCVTAHDSADNVQYEFTQLLSLDFTHKVRCLCLHEETQTLFIGTDLGDMERYRLVVGESVMLEFIDSIKLHENAILAITLYDNHVYTSGYDGNIRKVEINSNRVVGGGKLNKRLKGGKLMTSTVNDNIMLIATTNNELFSYYMEREIPIHVNTTNVFEPCNIRKILPCDKNVFVSHGNTVSCFSYSKVQVNSSGNLRTKRLESEEIELSTMCRKDNIYKDVDVLVKVPSNTRCAQFSPNDSESLLYSGQIYSILIRPRSKQLIAAHDEIISIWCTNSGKLLYAWYAHPDEQVHFIQLLREDDLLISGGSDGQIKLWRLPDDEKLK